MRVVVSGASGLIGRHLVPSLRADGHDVLVLVRREPRGPGELRWDPASGSIDPAALTGADAVVNLSGVGVGDHRWTPEYKREILSSRVQTTSTLVTAMIAQERRPSVLVNASAVGAYGEAGDAVLTEDSPWGDDFLAGVVREWEAATRPATDAGIRVAMARTGLLASPAGGAFGRLLTLFHLGVGGRLGSGNQWWSLISMPDEVRALTFLLENPVSGPVNLTAPVPAHNAVVTKALGQALHRPTVLAVPGIALRTVLGEFASSVLMSQRVVPQKLLDAGFVFRHPDATTIVDWLAGA
ncbi:TIGR01777 family oxidoreductase [Kineococcus rubinsiae]|uniref:TIGR01777 family oxidoreductase n=1 Tax=Kineococcus rubinsiae TaxID=2609562 RepID=UPI00142F9498|nr:TIGR01777 family oxidoreductase [Kineococcus rubinsiae]NIZ92506.1 TIGR01777 family protein [Kineococcus rubinsiae]